MLSKNKFTILLLFAGLLFSEVSCKKFVNVGAPETSTNAENVYATDATATAVLTGVYAKMSISGLSQGRGGISILAGLSADEFYLMSGADASLVGYYNNDLFVSKATGIGTDYWNPCYDHIYTCNSIIEGLAKSNTLTPAVKHQLLGEAKFIRGFIYFYLVNFFGDVPLVTSTDYTINASMPRTPKTDIYKQMIKDLKEAKELLSTDYLNASLKPYDGVQERVRPTKWAASALLARAYLYTGDWNNAEAESSIVINSSLFNIPLPALNNVFLKNSAEAIWQLQPTTTGSNTEDAKSFIITSSGLNYFTPVKLSSFILNAFEPADQRKTNGNWINSIVVGGDTLYYPFKYKLNQNDPNITSATGTDNMNEYLMVLRLGELYLIRAEARARMGDLSGAVVDLDSIRKRAGLTAYGGPASQAPLLSAILHERQVELFTEWGHRWFDLKRSNNVDVVMTVVTPQKSILGSTWKSYQQLYPLPFRELQTNPALVQNEGYQ